MIGSRRNIRVYIQLFLGRLLMNVKNIAEGIEWARRSWPQEGCLPIGNVAADYPFDPTDFFDNDRDELRDILEGELLRHPSDIAVRFTSILIPFVCSHCYSDDEPTGFGPSHEEHVREEFRKLLSHFVGLLRIEQCADWKRTHWEILNCYAARNWELARELYHRAEQLQLLNRDDLLLLRAQFDFFLVFGREMTSFCSPRQQGSDATIGDLNLALDSLLWPPTLLTELMRDNRRGASLCFFLLQWCLELDGQDRLKNKKDLESIIDAIRDFSLVINNRSDLKNLYTPLLARCYFAKGEFVSAGERYMYVAGLMEKVDGEAVSFRRLTLEAVAKCYELAERLPEAIDALKKCAQEFPTHIGLHTRMAMLFARMGKFGEITECLRAEQQRNPQVGEDWRDSTILALGSISFSGLTEDRIASLFYQLKPELARGIESVLCSLWTEFKLLNDQTRQLWAYGVHQANFYSEEQQGFAQSRTDAAVAFFAKAVEWELKTRLFNKWGDSVRRNEPPSTTNSSRSETAVLLRFVTSANPKITLGQMYHSLRHADESSDPLLSSLRSWANKNFPNLLRNQEALNALSQLAQLSGDAKHGSVQQGELLRTQELGRKVLDTLAETRSQDSE
jgi:hypothetical protein